MSILTKFDSGATRSADTKHVRFDLLCPDFMEKLAMIAQEGAEKHGDRNWQNGLPIGDTINHLINHFNLWIGGDRKEDHLAKAAFGLMMIIHFRDCCKCGENSRIFDALLANYTERKEGKHGG